MDLPEVVISDDLMALGIFRSRQTIHWQVKNGKLPRPRMLNNRYVWSKAQIEKYLEWRETWALRHAIKPRKHSRPPLGDQERAQELIPGRHRPVDRRLNSAIQNIKDQQDV
ncbi:AlpA family transcriptional regulator [Roseomonas sp. CECT 9278]|uniref:helix-turn-helix transcriptional regulator n=1 Tax=Roseomonas sp. CECT 9278 TaxID=2845823 RepID=UPI001E3234C3|nr:hypothetical protein [Roseomonas sp. CECT 9278]